MKAYTDIEQSKKLAEILPIESADMQFFLEEDYCIVQIKEELQDWGGDCIIPCWSLAALLDVLPYPSLHKTFSGWHCDSYDKEGKSCILGKSSDNPIDACYTMIVELKERNLI